MSLFRYINFASVSGTGITLIITTSVIHMFATNEVNNMEAVLKTNGADSSALEPILKWKRESFLKQIITKPKWD